MAKQTVTITVDSDLMEQVRQLRINISGTINEFLQSLVARYDEDISGINIKLEKVRIDKINKKLNFWGTEKKTTQSKIDKWEEVQKEKEVEKLKKEKEDIENQEKCNNCGELLSVDKKNHKFPIGMICNGCFLVCNAQDMKRWNNENNN